MTNYLHKNDLPDNIKFTGSVAIDSETMGLNILRDRLCLVQISAGDGDAHLVQFEKGNYNAPNLCKLLADQNIQKLFHFARFDLDNFCSSASTACVSTLPPCGRLSPNTPLYSKK